MVGFESVKTGKPLAGFYVAQAFTPGLAYKDLLFSPVHGASMQTRPAEAPARKPLKGLLESLDLRSQA